MLSVEDKRILESWDVPNTDFDQINEATGRKTTLTLQDITKHESQTKKISHKEARKILGNTTYLSGITRSAFHWTSARESDDGRYCVFFDSSALFKD